MYASNDFNSANNKTSANKNEREEKKRWGVEFGRFGILTLVLNIPSQFLLTQIFHIPYVHISFDGLAHRGYSRVNYELMVILGGMSVDIDDNWKTHETIYENWEYEGKFSTWLEEFLQSTSFMLR